MIQISLLKRYFKSYKHTFKRKKLGFRATGLYTVNRLAETFEAHIEKAESEQESQPEAVQGN